MAGLASSNNPSVLSRSPCHNFNKFTAINLYISPIPATPLAYICSTPEHRPDNQLRLHHGCPKPYLRLKRTGTGEVSRPPTSSSTYRHADPPYSPPFSARVSRSIDSIYNFFGLYFVSLFSVYATPHPANLPLLLTDIHSQSSTRMRPRRTLNSIHVINQTRTKHDQDGHPPICQELPRQTTRVQGDLDRGEVVLQAERGQEDQWELWTT